mgnify:CR=1 FL=1
MRKRNVVVTGSGAAGPNGLGREKFREAARKGESGIGVISRFDAAGLSVRIAGEVRGFDEERYLRPKEVPHVSSATPLVHARKLAGSSLKSLIGHPQGACGTAGVAPPTKNIDVRDPECDLDAIRGEARPMEIRCAVANCMGFGSKNSALALRREQEPVTSGAASARRSAGA